MQEKRYLLTAAHTRPTTKAMLDDPADPPVLASGLPGRAVPDLGENAFSNSLIIRERLTQTKTRIQLLRSNISPTFAV